MKLKWLLTLLLFAFFASPSLPASSNANQECLTVKLAEEDELPWSVVDAVFKKCAEVYDWGYSQLVGLYNQNLVTVEQSGSSYVVTIYDEDDSIVGILTIDEA